MNQQSLENTLADLPLSGIRYFDSLESTNDEAVRWAEAGAGDCSLVVADEQTAGRGRGSRRWFTPPGAALAFSLILHPKRAAPESPVARLTGLGALAVCRVLQTQYQLPAQIKWPNDVLLAGKKVAGVLVEAAWLGNQITHAVLGIGVNIAPSAVPPADWPGHHAHPFPAGCVAQFTDEPTDRLVFLNAILHELCYWYPRVDSAAFLSTWQRQLALRGEWVQIISPGAESSFEARLTHLNEDGSLHVEQRSGEQLDLRVGEIHLRPVDSSPK